MKQRDAAALLRVSRPFVAQILRGRRCPSLAVVARAAAALKCSDEEIGASVREMFPQHFGSIHEPSDEVA
jgi:transcriptional regulator with XRE-family HTH domain